MSELVKEGSASAKIVEEEVTLHDQVQERVRKGATARVEHLDASGLDRDLIELRDAIAEAKPEDLAPLVEQMTRLAAIRGRLGKGKDLPIGYELALLCPHGSQRGQEDQRCSDRQARLY